MSQENFIEIPVQFSRQGAFPLDRYSIFSSMEAARNYVSNNGASYNGQIISVYDSESEKYIPYIINNNSLEPLASGGVTITRYI